MVSTMAFKCASVVVLLIFLSPLLLHSKAAAQGEEHPAQSQSSQAKDPQTAAPVVDEFEPEKLSITSVLELRGYRLKPSSKNTKVFFLQNGNTYLAQTGGGSWAPNNENNGRQTLEVIVPEEVVLGPSQVVVETSGHRSVPVTVTIVNWALPQVQRIVPTSGSPGTDVLVTCYGIHLYDQIELTDAAGKVTSFAAGGSRNDIDFIVPKDAAEGPLAIRIGNRKYGNNQFTEPVIFHVTNDPLPLDLALGLMTPVASGQWLDLIVWSYDSLKHSELTEIAFKQADRMIIVSTPDPKRLQVAVPKGLAPGNVQVQTRTWRKGLPSLWSAEAPFKLSEKLVPPTIHSIKLKEGSWVRLRPGPDKPESFSATAGNVLVVSGKLRVADAKKIKVTLFRSGESIDLDVIEPDPETHWTGELVVRLPETLEKGDWRMLIANLDDGTQAEVPIMIRIK
jgi:hypothetical protein